MISFWKGAEEMSKIIFSFNTEDYVMALDN